MTTVKALEAATRKMWDAWQEYTEAKREVERLERQASDEFDAMAADMLQRARARPATGGREG